MSGSSKTGAEFQREIGIDADRWADEAMISAAELGFKVERDWLRSLIADAIDAGAIAATRSPKVP